MITGSIQEKNGKLYAVLNLYEDGKRKPKWINTGLVVRGNKKKAKEMLDAYLDEYNNKDFRYINLSVAEYFLNWLNEIKYDVKPNTYRSYYGNMINHIIPYFRDKKILLKDLKPYHLEKYYRYKLQPDSKLKSSEALSRTTIKHHHQNISKALSDAVRRGIIEYNPASSARTPKAEKFKAEFLNPSQIGELLILFTGNVVELPITLCALYGLRRSEVCGLKWKNISFENRTITICETVQQNTGGNYTDTPKTESSYRTLPMTDSIYTILKNKKRLQDQRAKLLGNYYVQNDYVCTWDNGELISPNYLTKTFHSVISKSTLPQIRLHDLRHSVASNLLSNGFSVVQVADFLGHESPNTTLKFYSHADKTSKISVANAMEKMISI